jgi:hypothetical protein
MTLHALKILARRIAPVLAYYPIVFMLGYLWVSITLHPAFLIPTLGYVYTIFKGTLDLVQGIGPIYWISRKDARIFSIGIGTMHELSAPWRKGKGIYIAAFRRSFQVGICRRQQLDEVSGTLSAVQGRYLDLSAHEIGNWNAVQKDTKARTTTA